MHTELGVLLALLAGAINGAFALPMKAMRHWSWENAWLPFSFAALVLFPRLIALRAVPKLENAYAHVPFSTLLIALVWGFAVYTGALLFGLSLRYIGNALAFALLVGTMSIVGVLAPIAVFNYAVLGTAGGKWILAGIALLTVALASCSRAGALKAWAETSRESQTHGPAVITGMLLAVIGGALSGLLSLGMNMEWARAITTAAVLHGGASQASATNAVLLPVLLGGAISNCLYCARLLWLNGTWKRYREHGVYWLVVAFMAIMYSGSVALWGLSTAENMLGRLGPSVGWALFIGAIVMSSNAGGFASGEWKNARGKPLRIMVSGVACMMLAMVLIGYGNYLLNA